MTAPTEDPRGGVMHGRHRSPPPAKPPDYTIPLGIAAGVLIAASLVAIAATAVAPDASAAARDGVTVSTASRSARTVHVPVTILPAPVPSIGPSNVWDPEADIALSGPTPFAGVQGHATAHLTTAAGLSEAATPTTAQTTQSQSAATTTTTATSPAESTAAATTSSATTTEEPTVTETSSASPTTDVIEITVSAEATP